MGALATYTTQVQRLLHDPNFQFWTSTELTDYINIARRRVCQDTKCLRQRMTGYALTTGQEQYQIASLPASFAPYVIDIMGIDLYWGNTRNPLLYMPWTQFNAQLRYWQTLRQRPIAFSREGALSIFFGPVPDQNYVTDWSIAINPNDLVSDSTPEQIPVPFNEPVPFWAAYEAKFKEQAIGEATIFQQEYQKRLMMIARSFFTRMIPDPYNMIGVP